jgi:hypothetical protein
VLPGQSLNVIVFPLRGRVSSMLPRGYTVACQYGTVTAVQQTSLLA